MVDDLDILSEDQDYSYLENNQLEEEEEVELENDLLLAQAISQSLADQPLQSDLNPPKQPVKRWTVEEDRSLLSAIQKYGFGRWVHVSQLVGTRSPLQCRNRAGILRKSGKIPAEIMQIVESFGKNKRRKLDNGMGDSFDLGSGGIVDVDIEEEEEIGVERLESSQKWDLKTETAIISHNNSESIPGLSRNSISQVEMESLPKWFAKKKTESSQRIHRSPTLYMKIRNHILDKWFGKRNEFLSKTEARKGLSGAVDRTLVNEIFTWLNTRGFINAGLDRRVRKINNPKIGAENPFELVPCLDGSAVVQDGSGCIPVQLEIFSHCLVLVDLHAHTSHSEIIGLMGGRISLEMTAQRRPIVKISIEAVYPCKSLHSSHIQCEMDSLTELYAREYFSELGLVAVGWYHSHPTFAPHPSRRDIETQSIWQRLFKTAHEIDYSQSDNQMGVREREMEPFVGLIMSPFESKTRTQSSFEVFHLLSSSSLENEKSNFSAPYRPHFEIVSCNYDLNIATQCRAFVNLICEAAPSKQSIDFDKLWSEEDKFSIRDKLIESLLQYPIESVDQKRKDIVSDLVDLYLSKDHNDAV